MQVGFILFLQNHHSLVHAGESQGLRKLKALRSPRGYSRFWSYSLDFFLQCLFNINCMDRLYKKKTPTNPNPKQQTKAKKKKKSKSPNNQTGLRSVIQCSMPFLRGVLQGLSAGCCGSPFSERGRKCRYELKKKYLDRWGSITMYFVSCFYLII